MIIGRYEIEYHGPGDDNQRIKDQGWRVNRASWMSPEARRKGRNPRWKLVFVDESMVKAIKYVKEETMKIIRTKEQIQALIGAINAELVGLPDYDVFGDSNADAKAGLRGWIEELEMALGGKLQSDDDTEAAYWLTDERGVLGKDYGIE